MLQKTLEKFTSFDSLLLGILFTYSKKGLAVMAGVKISKTQYRGFEIVIFPCIPIGS